MKKILLILQVCILNLVNVNLIAEVNNVDQMDVEALVAHVMSVFSVTKIQANVFKNVFQTAWIKNAGMMVAVEVAENVIQDIHAMMLESVSVYPNARGKNVVPIIVAIPVVNANQGLIVSLGNV
jgi:hypothetical protein